ncbi:MAG: guanylate kinase [Gemmatimonadota bacterium]|nr:MAG: guanylate kinase [Gemmatimonadota bacterium]
MTPFLIVLSAPSGGGKTMIAKALVAAREDLEYSVSATTRAPRQGEVDGVDYHFLSRAAFAKRRDAGEFLEWAEYGGDLYGTLEVDVDRAIGQHKHVILDIEVQGARQVRERRKDVVSIFILPPSAETLVRRLGGRDISLNEDALRRRLRRAVDELEEAADYDYVVVNEDRTQVVAEVAAIIDSESKRTYRDTTLQESLDNLRRDIAQLADKMVPN